MMIDLEQIQATRSEDVLDRLSRHAGQLYSLPAVAIEVLELTNRPEVNAEALKSCIERDPALTGKILRVVNSSLFGLTRQVSNLNQAVALLGIKPLKLLVLSFSLPENLFDDIQDDILAFYWRHSLTKAVAAKELAETIWKVPAEEAWIAGLLQDIGMLVLIQDLGQPYLSFLNKIGVERADLIVTQQEMLGFDHTNLSTRLLKNWKLPPSIVWPVHCQQASRNWNKVPSEFRALAQITYQAEYVAQLLCDQRPGALGSLLEPQDPVTRLTLQQLSPLVDSLSGKVLQMSELLNVSLPPEQDYSQIMAEAERLTVAANCEPISPHEWSESQAVVNAVQRPADHSHVHSLGDVASESDVRDTQRISQGEEASGGNLSRMRSRPQTSESTPWVNSPDASQRKLTEHVDRVLASCRQLRQPASLLFVDNVGIQSHWEEVRRCLATHLAHLIRDNTRTDGFFLRYDEQRAAVVLQGCDRNVAIEFARNLIEAVKVLEPALGIANNDATSRISAGVATVNLPPINFPIDQWIEAAERCLFASHASGGNIVKSIEIF